MSMKSAEKPGRKTNAMTEAEWLASKDIDRMLRSLDGKVGARKLRLFMAACARRVPGLLADGMSRAALEAAEGAAEGVVGEAVLKRAREGLQNAFRRALAEGNWSSLTSVWILAGAVCDPELTVYCATAVSFARRLVAWSRSREAQIQIRLLKDVVGNPDRPAGVDPSWLAWNGGTVRRIAAKIYEERQLPEGSLDTAGLAVLADALVDASCDNDDLLAHCRGEGPHVRGCWVVDLAAGKV